MGAWGNNIKQNDTVLDVIDSLQEHLKAGKSVQDAIAAFLAQPEWQSVLDDAEESALIHQGIAELAWMYGAIPQTLVARVRDDLDKGLGFASWSEPEKRRAAIEKFSTRIGQPNPKPKPLPKPPGAVRRFRRPGFNTGDCLSVHVGGGRHSAAYVVRAFQLPGQHGGNVILQFAYLSSKVPKLDDFKTMTPLVLTHHHWKSQLQLAVYGWRAKELDDYVTVVGNLDLSWPEIILDMHADTWLNRAAKRDPVIESLAASTKDRIEERDPAGKYLPICGWDLGTQVLMQDAWDKGQR